MNWLAHLLLSEPTAAFRIGNLLPDFVKPPLLEGLPVDFQRGIACHRRIDAFTDAHPVVRRSMDRFAPPFRRFAGILVDVFYDHFLAVEWPAHASTPLTDFVAEVHAGIELHREDLPSLAYERLTQMKSDNWLCRYGDLPGIETTLRRLSARLRRPFDLAGAVPVLDREYDAFRADFTEFFPQLRVHAETVTAAGSLNP
jgi:acyl carrier protein phosphodiesterase